MWELATVQCVQTLDGHTGVVMDLLCWDSFLLSCSLDGTVKVSVGAMAALLWCLEWRSGRNVVEEVLECRLGGIREEVEGRRLRC